MNTRAYHVTTKQPRDNARPHNKQTSKQQHEGAWMLWPVHPPHRHQIVKQGSLRLSDGLDVQPLAFTWNTYVGDPSFLRSAAAGYLVAHAVKQ